MVRRFLRIAPLFYFILVGNALNSLFEGINYSLTEYIINFTFIFNLIPGQEQSFVGGGWAIGVLVIFYLLVPIFIAFVRKIVTALALLVMSLILSSSCFFFLSYYYSYLGVSTSFGYMSIFTQMPFFLMGIVLFLLMRKKLLNQKILTKRRAKIIGLGLVGVSIFLAIIILWIGPSLQAIIEFPYMLAAYYAWGLAFSCLIAGFILYPCRIYVNKITKFIGDRSYGIYLLHPFVVNISMPVYQVIYGGIDNLEVAFLGACIFTLIVTLILAALSYKCLEKPALKYGEKLLLKNR